MPLTEKLIANETLVIEAKKHWVAPVRDSLWAGAMLLGAIVITALDPSTHDGFFGFIWDLLGLLRWILLIGGILWVAYNIVVWRTAEFAVTNLRVLRNEGLVRRRSSETLLGSVSDVKLTVGILGKSLGYGDLRIFTQSGDAGADDFTSITAPAEFRNAMMGEKLKDQAGLRTAAAPAPAPAPVAAPAPAPPRDDPAQTLVRLAELRDQGILSQAEFDAKKAEILGRI